MKTAPKKPEAPKKPRILLDTKPIIKLLAKEEGWEQVAAIMTNIEAGKIEAAISVVTLTEIYYKYQQEGRPDLATTRTDQLRYSTYIEKITIDDTVAVKAGELKGKYKIPIADAYIAASAHAWNGTVISDDPDFKKIKETETQTETELCRKLQSNTQ